MTRWSWVLSFLLVSTASCARTCSGEESTSVSPDAGGPEGIVETPPSSDASRGHVRDAEPAVDEARVVDGAVDDKACTGAEIDLAALLFDRRCAIGSSAAKRLSAALEDGGGRQLRQEAKLVSADRVEVRLVNEGMAPIALPLSWHPKIATLTALAEDEAHRTIDELEPPRLELPDSGAGQSGARFARVVLPPKGVGFVRATLATVVTKRIAPACEAGSCAPPKLAPGKYVLHVGELLADVEAGAPAELPWTVH
jgi:hypothetical protein